MKLVTLALCFVTALAAQRGHGGFGGRGGGFGGRGGGFAGRSTGWGGGWGARPSPGFRGGSHHSGIRPAYRRPAWSSYSGYGYGSAWGWGGSYYPYSWYPGPFWSTSAVYSVPPYQYDPGPNVVVMMVPPVDTGYAAAPAARPSWRSPATFRQEPEPDTRPLATESWAYLIATRSGTIWLAREYSVTGGMLEFATNGTTRRRIALAEVDRSLTEQLNRERGVAVKLP